MGFSIYFFFFRVAAGGKIESSPSSDQNCTERIFSDSNRNYDLEAYILNHVSS